MTIEDDDGPGELHFERREIEANEADAAFRSYLENPTVQRKKKAATIAEVMSAGKFSMVKKMLENFEKNRFFDEQHTCFLSCLLVVHASVV